MLLFSLEAFGAKVSYLSKDHAFMVLDQGLQNGLQDDQVVCLYRNKKLLVCGVVGFISDNESTILLESLSSQKKSLIKLKMKVELGEIPPKYRYKTNIDVSGKTSVEIQKKKSAARIVSIDQDQRLVTFRFNGSTFKKDDRVCVYRQSSYKNLACYIVSKVSRKFGFIRSRGSRFKTLQVGDLVKQKDKKTNDDSLNKKPELIEGKKLVPLTKPIKDENIKLGLGLDPNQQGLLIDKSRKKRRTKKSQKNKNTKWNSPKRYAVGGGFVYPFIARLQASHAGFIRILSEESPRSRQWEALEDLQPSFGFQLAFEVFDLFVKRTVLDIGGWYSLVTPLDSNGPLDDLDLTRMYFSQSEYKEMGFWVDFKYKVLDLRKSKFHVDAGLGLDYSLHFIDYNAYWVQGDNPERTLLANVENLKGVLGLRLPIGFYFNFRDFTFGLTTVLGVPVAIIDHGSKDFSVPPFSFSYDGDALLDLKEASSIDKSSFSFDLGFSVKYKI